jgi:chemotaxis protein MotA
MVDVLSITGLLLAAIAIMLGAILKGAGMHALVSAAAFMIVVVGTVAAICVQTPMQVMKRAMTMFPWILRPPTHDPVRCIKQDHRLEQHLAPPGTAGAGARC